MTTYATKEYAVKDVSIIKDGEAGIIYLIAVYHHNKISNSTGFVLYSTMDMEKWDLRGDTPFIDALLFTSVEEAFKMGENIFKMNLKYQLSAKSDQLPNPYPKAPKIA